MSNKFEKELAKAQWYSTHAPQVRLSANIEHFRLEIDSKFEIDKM